MNKKSGAYPPRLGSLLVHYAIFAAALALTLVSVSCATKLPPIPEQISSAEIVQKAQESSDAYDWKAAQYYYKALLERYPNDDGLVLEAMYELAFIEYKQAHFEAAKAGLTAVLGKYAAPGGDALPPSWKILSEKVLAKIPATTTK